jgi:hypothetical protein
LIVEDDSSTLPQNSLEPTRIVKCLSAIADVSGVSARRQPVDCLTTVQGKATDAPNSLDERAVSDHNLR